MGWHTTVASTLRLPTGTALAPGGSGAINVYNNTFYNCGGPGLTDTGAIGALNCAAVTVALNNNLIVQPGSGVPYLTGSAATITATSNDCFGYNAKSGPGGVHPRGVEPSGASIQHSSMSLARIFI
jgi:hypothetical protein